MNLFQASMGRLSCNFTEFATRSARRIYESVVKTLEKIATLKDALKMM